MIKTTCLSIVFILLNVANTWGQSWLSNALVYDKFDSLIQFYGKEKLVEALIEFDLGDTVNQTDFVSNDSLYSKHDFVWNTELAYAPLSSLERGRVTTQVISLKMKALFWAWLIYMDSNNVRETPQERIALYDTTIDSSNMLVYKKEESIPDWPKHYFIIRSPIVFDYSIYRNHPEWEYCPFIKQHTESVKEIEAVFKKWGTAYRTNGLKYLQERKISPLHNNYIFKRLHVGL